MKIGTLSDIHFDRHQQLRMEDYIEALAQLTRQKELDLLIIAGDISNHYSTTLRFIKQLTENVACGVYFIPGNHDIWRQADEIITSEEILALYTAHPQCLINQPLELGQFVIVGHMGWYDYHFASNKYTLEKLERGKHYGATWQDKVHTNFEQSDQMLSKRFAESVFHQLEPYLHHKVVLVTHVVTHPKFVVPLPHRIFDFFNAFIGTQDFDYVYEHYDVAYSVMGHVHFRKRYTENGTTYLCSCLGYPREWRGDDLFTELKDALQMIELPDSDNQHNFKHV